MAKQKHFKSWPLYTLLAGFVVPTVAVFGYVYYEAKTAPASTTVTQSIGDPTTSALTNGLFSYFKDEEAVPAGEEKTAEAWEAIYPKTSPMQIGSTMVAASIAESWPDRIKGLSDTPYLPKEVVKLFRFDSLGYHGIWMKDMNYAIDIIWVDETNSVVHIARSVSPDTYPETFSPSRPALYVIEAAAGFAEENGVVVGTPVTLPAF